jgi:hypothetical protein
LFLYRFRDQLSEHFQIRDYFEHVKPVTVDQIIEKKKFFPRKEKDKAKAFTLVLDMDETLIHTIEQDRSFDAVVDSYDDEHLIQVGRHPNRRQSLTLDRI